MYSDDDLLMLSGIQHIAFCERQYALIYIEEQWEENVLTIQGHHIHERVDDPLEIEKRDNIITLRSVYLVSYSLGLYGKADVIELIRTEQPNSSLMLPEYNGYWKVKPVEYKRGKPKPDVCDEVQLCAQAICLEEMYHIKIESGDIFYGKPRRRKEVIFDGNLRKLTKFYSEKMHNLYQKGITPLPNYLPKCKSCSLIDICKPKQLSIKQSVKSYFLKYLNFET